MHVYATLINWGIRHPSSHHLAIHIRESAQLGLSTTTVNIGNLSPLNVKSLVAEVLQVDDYLDDIEFLSNIVHKKTEGNVFSVLLFLKSLYDEELLKYNVGSMKWIWNDADIKKALMTQNVTTLMVKKLHRFAGASQVLMKIGSCMGNSFSIENVVTIAKNLSKEDLELDLSDDDIGTLSESTSSSVRELIEEGLLDIDEEDCLCFGHDQIQVRS